MKCIANIRSWLENICKLAKKHFKAHISIENFEQQLHLASSKSEIHPESIDFDEKSVRITYYVLMN